MEFFADELDGRIYRRYHKEADPIELFEEITLLKDQMDVMGPNIIRLTAQVERLKALATRSLEFTPESLHNEIEDELNIPTS